jgi:mRNA-degrading endonuclease RelE of RelBE toxin-antitoxin system
MAKRPKYTLSFAPEVVDHLDSIEAKHHGLLRRTMKEQLTFTPAKETRNRKPLESPTPFGAAWELRCGPKNTYRVFYEIDAAALTVRVLAIGVKERSRLLFGGEEYES